MSLRVYAIVPAAARAGGRGIDGERLRVVRAGPLAAVVGAAGRRHGASPARLLAYDRLLQRLAAQVVTLVPVRFGTVLGEAELAVILRTRRGSFQRTLAHVRRRAQMTVRLIAVEPSRRAAAATSGTVPNRRVSGTKYLRHRAREAAEARRVAELTPLRAAVRRWIRDEQIDRRGRLATMYHLIPRASAVAYRRALARAARAHDVPIAISGPWVPYAFSSPEGGFGG